MIKKKKCPLCKKQVPVSYFHKDHIKAVLMGRIVAKFKTVLTDCCAGVYLDGDEFYNNTKDLKELRQ
jgi:hypothetical protein